MGRPSVWNPDLEERVLSSIEAGDSERVAAEAEGISYTCFREHRAADPAFATRCMRARAAGLQVARRELMETTDPTRAKVRLRMLACKDPEGWAEEQRVRHSGSIGLMEALATPTAPDRSTEEASGE